VKTSKNQHKNQSRAYDLALAYKLWDLTQSEFAWLALIDLARTQAEALFRKDLQAGKYKGRKLDEVKRRKIIFLRTAELISELKSPT
jgi:hypothetical protein